ncbi:MAG: GNAT family N-acetyltransferase [Devosiaceae bacterium]|nr:GNAT family N-acetyltransferase [Devosiaceae bacterium]
MDVLVSIETPLQDDVRALINGLNDHLVPLSPIEFQFKMSAEEMAGDDTLVFVARDKVGLAVGLGALKSHGSVEGEDLGEVKRMFTLPAVRGQRVGVALLEAIIGKSKDLGHSRLMLETGIGEGYAGAWRLYERSGFKRREAFLDYPDSGHSAFFEKAMSA